jgi:hypothetical protein
VKKKKIAFDIEEKKWYWDNATAGTIDIIYIYKCKQQAISCFTFSRLIE